MSFHPRHWPSLGPVHMYVRMYVRLYSTVGVCCSSGVLPACTVSEVCAMAHVPGEMQLCSTIKYLDKMWPSLVGLCLGST